MFRAVLIDDDVDFINKLQTLLEKHYQKTNITFEYTSITSSFNKIDYDINYDVAFIDIDLNTSVSGIDIAKMINNRKTADFIIFISSKQNLIFDALVTQPFYFVRKSNLNKDLSIALNLLDNRLNEHYLFTFHYMGRNTILKQNDIFYIEINNHDAILHLENSKYHLNTTMSNLLDKLTNPNFIQIHRSYAINANHLIQINQNNIVLSNNISLPIGKKYKDSFIENYKNIL